jgi:DNA polymerase-3 subunit gamma/tau
MEVVDAEVATGVPGAPGAATAGSGAVVAEAAAEYGPATPDAPVARTRNHHVAFAVSPVTVKGGAAMPLPTCVHGPPLAVARSTAYALAPPAGAVHESVADACVTASAAGAPGAAAVVTARAAADGADSPPAFAAFPRYQYAAFGARPASVEVRTVALVVAARVHVADGAPPTSSARSSR